MTDPRKKKLTELAEYVAKIFRTGNVTRLEDLAAFEGVQISYDNYERAFDGMLVLDDDSWHIHMDLDGRNFQGSGKGRFSMAHELAHYLIEEHKAGIANGEFLHGSKFNVAPADPREREANYFASVLLMPSGLFKALKTPRTFNIETIFQLSQEFQTSFLATVQRFCEVGTHSVCIVFSQNGIVKWFRKSNDFPDWAFRFKMEQMLPANSVAAEFFARSSARYSAPEQVDPSIWFYPKWDVNGRMREQCYYSDSYGYAISILWFDK